MSRALYLRPSGAATWSKCAGYASFCEAYPDADPDESDNEVREDGTAMHWLAAEIVKYRRYHPVDTISPNNRILHDELFEATETYVDFLNWHNEAEWQIEEPVNCSSIYPYMTGTPDAWQYVPGLLRVADFKGGFRFVEVWGNLQLIIYAVSIAEMLELPESCNVELTIVQPRSYHSEGAIRTWCVTLGDLKPYVHFLRHAAERAMEPHPTCTPNPGCRNCPGRHACVAFQNAAYGDIEFAYGSTPHELEPAQLAIELLRIQDAIDRLESRFSGLSVQAEKLLDKGTVVPGWAMGSNLGRTRWRADMEEQIKALGDIYKADLFKPPALITPTQAAKLIPPDVIKMYSFRPSTARKLTKTDKLTLQKLFSPNYKTGK